MTYLTIDTSTQDGRPAELFKFSDGSASWFYCTGDVPIPYNGDVYIPATISRTATEASQEFGKSKLTIRLPHNLPLAQHLAAGFPNGPVTVTLFRTHVGSAQFITHWRGRVVSTTWRDVEASIVCEPVFTSLQRAGLRAVYQRQCRHALYSEGCGVNKNNFRLATVADTAINNQVFVLAAGLQSNNFFTGGMLKALGASRLIVAHSGTSLTLISPIPGIFGGTPVEVFPGCDHTIATCGAKFNNTPNFGGQPWLPIKNPFSGDAIV
jgi:uncharacterized phage protein (TIGR02218 family)